ncbi:MAG TPA: AAA family ATPase [Silvibacterium sp.]|nr:AAA family ATPase [Silvibacterium sp.]
MFWSYYGFRESPFGVTPDPRYLFASETHREALAALLYGINSGLGFMALTAMPGMGKTTLLFEVLDTIRRRAVIVFLFQSISTPIELLQALLIELGISSPQGGLIELQVQLNELLIKHSAEGKRFVLAIDEAQNLNDAVLEQVRMLSNFETSREKLMQIILTGQPQLTERLASPELLQLRQRISIVARLEPLTEAETAAYIRHRLTVAGYPKDAPLFTPAAIAMISRHSEGIPRNINNLCFNALAVGCALRQTTIGPDVIREVIADLDLKPRAARIAKVEDEPPLQRPASRLLSDDAPPPQRPVSRLLSDDAPPPQRPASRLLSDDAPPPQRPASRLLLDDAPPPQRPAPRLLLDDAPPPQMPSLRLLSDIDTADDEPERAPLLLKVVPLLCAVILVFAFVYVRYLRPYRGSFHFDIPAMVASQPETSANAAATGTPVTTAASETPDPPDTSATPEASETPEAQTPVTPARSIRVRHGQTLFNICAQMYRNCKPEVYRAFLEANPGIRNPNHIVSGQKVFIPTSLPSSSSDARH